MKILLYTITDFKPMYKECIDLLLSSITFDIPVNFTIIDSDHKQNKNYIGILKYSPKIPKNYDYYIYLDSDILYFDKISRLINPEKRYTLVYENTKIKKNPWWYFKHSNTDTSLLEDSQAINAGSFCFAQSEYSILNDIYSTYHKNLTANVHENAKLEQAIFNYYVYQYINFQTQYVHDITHMTQLFASDYPLQDTKKLYHFCGFTNTMDSKYSNMKKIYDQYISQK